MPRSGYSPDLIKTMQSLLVFIREYQAVNHGESPSRREMADHLGTSTTSVVNYYLTRMANDGQIAYDPYKPRSIVILSLREFVIHACPVVGCRNNGNPYDKCPDHDRTFKPVKAREL